MRHCRDPVRFGISKFDACTRVDDATEDTTAISTGTIDTTTA